MANSSILGGVRAAKYAPGDDVNSLGPSDSSDCGSDVQGEHRVRGESEHADLLGSLIIDTATDSESSGTGERASATGRDSRDGADIATDHVTELPQPPTFTSETDWLSPTGHRHMLRQSDVPRAPPQQSWSSVTSIGTPKRCSKGCRDHINDFVHHTIGKKARQLDRDHKGESV